MAAGDQRDPAAAGGRPVADTPADHAPHRRGRLALSTAFFSFATALSRVAGLAREVVAASYFGVSAAMSAFTIAFQVPNLVRALFADMALQGAFVPVFTDLLEKGRRQEAFRVASTLLFLICLVLGGLTALFILAAPAVISVVAPGFDDDPVVRDLTIALSRLLFPIVVLLGLSGLVVGMLNSFEHFSVPALAPLAWNLVIIGALVGLTPAFPAEDQIYAYAIGVLAGTVVQLLLPVPWLRGRGGRFTLTLDWRDSNVRRVLIAQQERELQPYHGFNWDDRNDTDFGYGKGWDKQRFGRMHVPGQRGDVPGQRQTQTPPSRDEATTRSQEEMRVSKQRQEAGTARLRKYVVTEPHQATAVGGAEGRARRRGADDVGEPWCDRHRHRHRRCRQ